MNIENVTGKHRGFGENCKDILSDGETSKWYPLKRKIGMNPQEKLNQSGMLNLLQTAHKQISALPIPCRLLPEPRRSVS